MPGLARFTSEIGPGATEMYTLIARRWNPDGTPDVQDLTTSCSPTHLIALARIMCAYAFRERIAVIYEVKYES